MSCQIIRHPKTNEIQQVLDPYGNISSTYTALLEISKNKEEAASLWKEIYSEDYRLQFGDWRSNLESEPTAQEAMANLRKAGHLVMQQKYFEDKLGIDVYIDTNMQQSGALIGSESDIYKQKVADGLIKEGQPLIAINPKLANLDTISHEVAHILIDTIGLEDVRVKAALESLKKTDVWKSIQQDTPPHLAEKELLAVHLGMEIDDLFDAYSAKHNESFINNLFRQLRRILYKIGAFLGVEVDQVRNLAKEAYGMKGVQLNTDTQYQTVRPRKTFDELDTDIKKDQIRIKFDEDSHTYEINGRKMRTSASGIVSEFYGEFVQQEAAEMLVLMEMFPDAKNRPNKEDLTGPELAHFDTEVKIKLGGWETVRELGSRMHTLVEQAILDRDFVYNESIHSHVIDKKAGKEFLTYVKNLVERIELAGGTIFTEAKIADEVNDVGSMADILILYKDGTIDIFDWKFSRGKSDTTKYYRSKKHRHLMQLSIYERLFYNRYGVNTNELRILPIHISSYKFIKGRAYIDGIKIEQPKIYKNKGNVQSIEYQEAAAKARTRLPVGWEQENLRRQANITDQEHAASIESIERIIEDVKESIEKLIDSRPSKAAARFRTALRKELNKIESLQTEKAIIELLRASHRQIQENISFLQRLDKSQAINSHYLQRFRHVMQAFNVYEDLSKAIKGTKFEYLTPDEQAQIDAAIDDGITLVNEANSLYVFHGKRIVSDTYAKKSTYMRTKFINEKTKEFKESVDAAGKRLFTDEQAKEKAMKLADEKAEEIYKDEYNRIYAKLDILDDDLGAFATWMWDAKQQNSLIQLTSKLLDEADWNTRAQARKVEGEVEEVYRKYVEWYKKKNPGKNASFNMEEMFDMFLEKDDNNEKTGYLIGEYHSDVLRALKEDYESARAAETYMNASEIYEMYRELHNKYYHIEKPYTSEYYRLMEAFNQDLAKGGLLIDKRIEEIRGMFTTEDGFDISSLSTTRPDLMSEYTNLLSEKRRINKERRSKKPKSAKLKRTVTKKTFKIVPELKKGKRVDFTEVKNVAGRVTHHFDGPYTNLEINENQLPDLFVSSVGKNAVSYRVRAVTYTPETEAKRKGRVLAHLIVVDNKGAETHYKHVPLKNHPFFKSSVETTQVVQTEYMGKKELNKWFFDTHKFTLNPDWTRLYADMYVKYGTDTKSFMEWYMSNMVERYSVEAVDPDVDVISEEEFDRRGYAHSREEMERRKSIQNGLFSTFADLTFNQAKPEGIIVKEGKRIVVYGPSPGWTQMNMVQPMYNNPRYNSDEKSENYTLKKKFINKKFKGKNGVGKLQQGHPARDMYDLLVKLSDAADEQLGTLHARHAIGQIKGKQIFRKLPSVEKTDMETLYENGFKDLVSKKLGDTWKRRADELEEGDVEAAESDKGALNTMKVMIGLNKKRELKVPVHFRGKAARQSYNLPHIFLINYIASTRTGERTRIEDDLNLAAEVLGEGQHYMHQGLSRKLWVRRDKDGKVGRPIIYKNDDLKHQARTHKVIQSILEHRLYDIKYKGNFGSEAGKFSVASMVGSLTSFTSTNLISFNKFSGITNVIAGKLQNILDSRAGLYPTSSRNGTKKYRKYFYSEFWKDMRSGLPQSKMGRLMRMFDVFHDQFNMYRQVTDTNYKKNILDWSILYIYTTAGEHFIAGSALLAILDTYKIMNKDGQYLRIKEDGTSEVVENAGQASSLDEAFMNSREGLKLHPDVYRTDKDTRQLNDTTLNELKHKIKDILADAQGQYDDNMISMAQRIALVAPFFSMRRWMIRGINKRYRGISPHLVAARRKLVADRDSKGKKIIHAPLEGMDEDMFYNESKQMFEEGTITSLLWYLRATWDTYKKTEGLGFFAARGPAAQRIGEYRMQNARRQMLETLVIILSTLGATAIWALSKGVDDDDEWSKEKAQAVAFYLRRVSTEYRFYYWPRDILKVIQTPAAATSVIEKFFKVIEQLLSDISSLGLERYKSGKHKGESKLYHYLLDLMPILNQMDRTYKNSYEWLSK